MIAYPEWTMRLHYACDDCRAGLDDVGDLELVGAGVPLAFHFAVYCCFCGYKGDGITENPRIQTRSERACHRGYVPQSPYP